ncbi:membrane protein [Nonlabens ulvanivorans]|uniref:Regulatory sensor-transducer n=1 Tax=Nonlabens ulvanivorans TaxID=906888 RepID=A0A084JXY0_NONUL|nr:membrane protein [Nonlabens ulvanivorans]KEZ93814.1 hypothetical protein IL45_06355 [Nonlabens ulvanivorans]PRX14420.1 hypothetical protein LY02_01450 [Nonlabens ulvanivorans]GAK77482.1 hypothetical protein JCM19296_3090 [Nonlabens ulvanivorans]
MFIRRVTLFKWVNGMVIWPFLLVQDKKSIKDPVFMNHERIHARQQLELILILFFIWYLIEYCVLRLKYSHDRAYRNIVFEREAYAMECDLDYLKFRKTWSFIKFYSQKYRV